MGTTATAIAAGSTQLVFVAAIEGFSKLITDGPIAAVLTAWAGTDWTQAIGGLHRQIDTTQTFDPWEPFQGGGTCTLAVVPDSTQALAIEMSRTDTTPDTELTASVDRDDTTINVKYADAFTAAPSEAFIGNECFEYSAKTTTTFTASKRGKYSPFASGGVDTRFAGEHRISAYDLYTTDVPIVTQYRRDFEGAWVGVWAHRVVGGVLDTRAQAQLVFAGQIDEFGQDASDTTVIHCRHVLDIIRDRAIGGDQYTARAGDAIYLDTNSVLGQVDEWDGTTQRAANHLTVVSSGAVAPGQINAGYYSIAEIIDIFNAWLDYERGTAHSIVGYYSVSTTSGPSTSGANVGLLVGHARFSVSVGSGVQWLVSTANPTLQYVLGCLPPGGLLGGGLISGLVQGTGNGSTDYTNTLPNPINRAFAGSLGRFELDQEVGTFFDQSSWMPPQYAAYMTPGQPAGIFLASNNCIMVGYVAGGEFFGQIVADPPINQYDPSFVVGPDDTFTITQILALSMSCYALMQYLFFSTGTANYNSLSSYDAMTSGYGMNIPGGLMANFGTTLAGVPGFDLQQTLWIMRPTKFAELLGPDFVLRGMHMVWRNGSLEFAVWSTPIAALAIAALNESNKAEPAGDGTSQSSTTLKSALWASPVLNIKFDWNPIDDTFGPALTLVDRRGVDIRGGGLEPRNIEIRTLGSGQSAKESLAILLGGAAGGDIGFVAKWIPFASRPLRMISRSLAQTKFEGLCPGDIVTVTDAEARDPATGAIGLTTVPGMILKHRANYGGLAPAKSGAKPSVNPQSGDVDLMVMAVNRSALWSPAAEVDETANTGGFTAGYNAATNVLRCKAHAYSEASETADASHFAGQVYITAIDPASTASPTVWLRTVASVSGNDITLTAALAAPAFDTTLTYRITSVDYSSADPSLQVDAFMADQASGLVDGVPVHAYQYGLAGIDTTTPTAPSHTDGCEYIADLAVTDGSPFDTGNHKSLARTINNLMDHRTAHQHPSLGKTVMVGDPRGVGAPYRLAWTAYHFFGVGRYGAAGATGASVRRFLYASLFMRSNTAATAHGRVTLSRYRISDAYLTEYNATAPGYRWTGPYSQVTFSAPNATWITTAEGALDMSVLDVYGGAWVSIELDGLAQSLGLAQLVERERV
jgi:hypothetical protein